MRAPLREKQAGTRDTHAEIRDVPENMGCLATVLESSDKTSYSMVDQKGT